MIPFYSIIIALSGAYLSVQLYMWVMHRKLLFGQTATLFESKPHKELWQAVFPKNLLLVVVFVFISGIFGLIFDRVGIKGALSLPFGAAAGFTFNFLLNLVIIPLVRKEKGMGEPTEEELEGMTATVTVEIPPWTESDLILDTTFAGNYGEILIERGISRYRFNAVSANGDRIAVGAAVIVIYCENGCCFVESEERFLDAAAEEDEDKPETGE